MWSTYIIRAIERPIWLIFALYISFAVLVFLTKHGPAPFNTGDLDIFMLVRHPEILAIVSLRDYISLVISGVTSGVLFVYIFFNGRRLFYQFFGTLTGIGRDDDWMYGRNSKNNFDDVQRLANRIEGLEAQKRTGLTDKERTGLSKTITEELRSGIAPGILKQIKKEHGQAFLKQQCSDEVDEKIEMIVRRLSRERQTITLWTFLNLAAGGAAAVYGAYLLYHMIGELKIPEIDDGKFHYAALSLTARLSLVIIIEIFAYFFLNLYRTGLQEIKFYQNEITNALSRQAGVRAALFGSDKSVVSYAITQLIVTERNFILKKGESTVGLEQNRLDRDADSRMTESVASAFNAGFNKAKGAAAKAVKRKTGGE